MKLESEWLRREVIKPSFFRNLRIGDSSGVLCANQRAAETANNRQAKNRGAESSAATERSVR